MRNFAKSAAFVAAALLSTSAMAAEGTAELNFINFTAGYELEHNGMKVEGHQYNLGSGTGAVKLERKDSRTDGQWSGRFGIGRAEVRKALTRTDGKMEVEVRTLPGGTHRFTIETKADRTKITGWMSGSYRVTAELKTDGSRFTAYNDALNFSLKSKNGMNYDGTAFVTTPRGGHDTSTVTLDTTGTLAPAALMTADPALFVLVYVVPYNL